MEPSFNKDEYLCHHGIKNQEWGERRYQNEDGSLTEAGRLRYYGNNGKLSRKGKRLFKKETKILKKLKNEADIDKQKKELKKAKRYEAAQSLSSLLDPSAGREYWRHVNKKKMERSYELLTEEGHKKALSEYRKHLDKMKKTFGKTSVSKLDGGLK